MNNEERLMRAIGEIDDGLLKQCEADRAAGQMAAGRANGAEGGHTDGLSRADSVSAQGKAPGQNSVRKQGSSRVWLRGLVAAALAALLCAGAFAAYTRWRLPAPTPYENGNNGIYDEHSQQDYTRQDVATPDVGGQGGATTPDGQGGYSDRELIARAGETLQAIGLTDVDTGSMTVTRRTNQLYGREEAEVAFPRDGNHTSLTFHAKTGALLSISSIDWIDAPETPACRTDAEAEAAATAYYQKLPVQQGYVLAGCQKYDEQYWSYEFCREVSPGLYNFYEMVRVAINPQNGRLTGCNVFFFPLLDDHQAGDRPLTQEQAEAAAQKLETINLEGYTLKNAQIAVALPNWMFTGYTGANLQYADVSRLAWQLTYEKTDGEFVNEVQLNIDLYTGELLGGDAAK